MKKIISLIMAMCMVFAFASTASTSTAAIGSVKATASFSHTQPTFTAGEVYDDSMCSDDSDAEVTEQPITEDDLASDFSTMVKGAPPAEVNYTLIPAYRFLYEEDLNNIDTDKPFYWNAVSYIYGTHFMDAGVGDFIPVGVYVSDDGTYCYVIDKKSEGTSTKTTYSILGDNSEDYEVISVDTYSD